MVVKVNSLTTDIKKLCVTSFKDDPWKEYFELEHLLIGKLLQNGLDIINLLVHSIWPENGKQKNLDCLNIFSGFL